DCRDCGREARPRTHTVVRCRRRPVHADPYAPNGQCGQPISGGIVDAATVGLELERSACARKRLEKLPAMGYSERLAAAERNIRNAEAIDLARDRQRFVARRFIGPRLVGSGFFATGDATRIAAIGQLPGDKKGRAVLLDRTPPAAPWS